MAQLRRGSKEYNEVLNRELEAFSTKFLQAIIKANKKVPEASGKSAKSFEIEVLKAGANNLAELRLYFETGPRFYEYKKLNYGQSGPPVEVIKEWIKSIGIGKFENKYLKLYGKIPANPSTFLNSVAWGIIKSGKIRKKRIRWYSKTHTYQYYRLMDKLSYAMSQAVVSETKQILQNGK